MKIEKIVILLMLCVIFTFLIPGIVLAYDVLIDQSGRFEKDKAVKTSSDTTIESIESGMKNVNQVNTKDSKVAKILNSVIKLIQIAGTGISVLMVTMLGIKYMLASSSEKAEIKKTAMPIIIGCVLLFAAVNLVGIVASVGDSLN